MEDRKACVACGEEVDETTDLDEAGLCACCSDLNYWAHEVGWMELDRCLACLKALGRKLSLEGADGTTN